MNKVIRGEAMANLETHMSSLSKHFTERGTKNMSMLVGTSSKQGFREGPMYNQECYQVYDEKANYVSNSNGGGFPT